MEKNDPPSALNTEPCPWCSGFHPLSAQFCPLTGNPLLPDDGYILDTHPGKVFQSSQVNRFIKLGVSLLSAIGLVIILLLVIPILSRNHSSSVQPTGNYPTLPPLTTQIGSEPATTTPNSEQTQSAWLTEAASANATPTSEADSSAWQACQGYYDSRLHVGDHARVTAYPYLPNRIRAGAGTDFPVLGYIEPEEEVEVIQGPGCADNWVWWRVRSLTSGLDGWTSEGDGSVYWLEPVP